jgi:hypothetical protein
VGGHPPIPQPDRGQGRVIKHPVDIELLGVTEPPGSVLYARANPTDNNKENHQ